MHSKYLFSKITRGRLRTAAHAHLSSAIPSTSSTSITSLSRNRRTPNNIRHIYGSTARSLNPTRTTKRAISMAWYCSGSTNTELIENLFSAGLIKNERVKNAMIGVDRANYAPSSPYSDSPQPIGHSATISAPHMHGHACEYLVDFLKPGSRVLDIGSGSGYLTHVLANLTTDPSSPPGSTNGEVIGIDHIPELVNLANNNMSKSEDGRKFLESGNVKFITADGRLGWKKGAPYDVIHVGAAAESLHPVLVEQLRAPGRMFIPVETENSGGGVAGRLGLGNGQYIWVVDKKADGSVHKEKVFQVSYVPLTNPPRR